MKSSVLFLVFNRPDTTRQVFEAIRAAQPPRLYIAADGPRSNRRGEAELCAEVRRIVAAVNWPCEVKTLFRDANLGCKRGPCGAISWFFENEEEGIILEDDCLPAPSFFLFCDELLERYRADSRVWQISGTNIFGTDPASESRASYRFSRYGPIWGWATWRRAWKHYDPDLRDWPAMSRPNVMKSAYSRVIERESRLELGDRMYSGEDTVWDYQWSFAKTFNYALSIIPCENMIRNIGFGPDATHTTGAVDVAPQKLHDLSFPLRHPTFFLPDSDLDEKLWLLLNRSQPGLVRRAVSRLARLMLLR